MGGYCVICRSDIIDNLNLGEMKEVRQLKAHYYCLLLATTISQSGGDEEGILGFLPKDINDEVERCKSRRCCYCKESGAAVRCSAKSCKRFFHLPCGIINGSGHKFYDEFLSTCHTHRPRQKYRIPSNPMDCVICFENIDFKEWNRILWAPCCRKNAYFHKECIQKLALSAGYFFKCPVCNDTSKFPFTMKNHGVFIPDQDASWELCDAFNDLYIRHNECNAENCLCPDGRNYDSGFGNFRLMLCNSCGSRGIHGLCRTVKKKRSWTCPDCQIDNTRPVSPVSPDVHGASGQPALSQCCESSSDVIIIDDDDETPPEVEPETRREPSQSLTGAIRKRFRQDAETLASCSQQVDGFIVKRARSLQTTFTNVSDRIFSNKENHMDSERGVDALTIAPKTRLEECLSETSTFSDNASWLKFFEANDRMPAEEHIPKRKLKKVPDMRRKLSLRSGDDLRRNMSDNAGLRDVASEKSSHHFQTASPTTSTPLMELKRCNMEPYSPVFAAAAGRNMHTEGKEERHMYRAQTNSSSQLCQ